MEISCAPWAGPMWPHAVLHRHTLPGLAALFPNAVTETIDEFGEVVRAIDKDVLMQEISATVVSTAAVVFS